MIAKNVEAKNIKIIRDMIKSDIKYQGSVTALLDKKSKVKWKSDKELKRKNINKFGKKETFAVQYWRIVERCRQYGPSSSGY